MLNDPQFLEDTSVLPEKIKPTIEGLEEIAFSIRSYTGLPIETCKILLEVYWQEIANSMLKGDIIKLPEFGTFLIKSPKNSSNKNQVVAKFSPSKHLLKKLQK